MDADAAGGGGGTPIAAHTESLAQAASAWSKLLPRFVPLPETSAVNLHYSDPTSSAVATAVVEWPLIHDYRSIHLDILGLEFIIACDNTRFSFTLIDQSGADRISSAAGAALDEAL